MEIAEFEAMAAGLTDRQRELIAGMTPRLEPVDATICSHATGITPLLVIEHAGLVVVGTQVRRIPWSHLTNIRATGEELSISATSVTGTIHLGITAHDRARLVKALDIAPPEVAGFLLHPAGQSTVPPKARPNATRPGSPRLIARATAVCSLGDTVAVLGMIFMALSVLAGLILAVQTQTTTDGVNVYKIHPYLAEGVILGIAGAFQGLLVLLIGRYAAMRALAILDQSQA